MMKVMILLIFFLFIFNLINAYLMQFILQNLILLMMFIFMMFPMNNYNFWMQIYYNLGLDYYSMGLILLSMWIIMLMIMMSMNNLLNYLYKYYVIIIYMLLLFLLFCFISMNIMMFYLFFESSLIPVFLLIMGWGYQVDRIQAGFYMMIYTLLGSLPLFFMIFMLYKMNNTLMFNMIELFKGNIYFYMLIMMAFLIKMPMYLLHLWLPKAHVEAPLVGSMILAGVMLKLGSYGLIRFMIIMMNLSIKFNKFTIIISLMGGVYSSLICLCQLDMKMLVAYSSVVHMSLLMSGLMTLFNWGYFGGMMMMIAHGLCSSGLFCLVNINYERLNSRSLMINKGLNNFFPSLSLIWFMLCSSNLSFPPSLNLFSEIMLLMSLVMWNKMVIIMLMIILFFGASYSLYLYSFTQHGVYNKLIYYMKSIIINEYLVLLLHWIPLNIMFMYMYMYM